MDGYLLLIFHHTSIISGTFFEEYLPPSCVRQTPSARLPLLLRVTTLHPQWMSHSVRCIEGGKLYCVHTVCISGFPTEPLKQQVMICLFLSFLGDGSSVHFDTTEVNVLEMIAQINTKARTL